MCSLISQLVTLVSCSPVCATCVWAGVDFAWEQGKLEGRKILDGRIPQVYALLARF